MPFAFSIFLVTPTFTLDPIIEISFKLSISKVHECKFDRTYIKAMNNTKSCNIANKMDLFHPHLFNFSMCKKIAL
jgi:hypothetical protein